MRPSRSSGLLLHPTSLPGPFGIGDLGEDAERFVEFLEAAGQSIWQVLPLGPTGYGDSPYQCFSAFAGNPLLISPRRLFEEGLLSKHDLEGGPGFSPNRVDFGAVIDFKLELLDKACERLRSSGHALRNDFETFCHNSAQWLDDYALFRALKRQHRGIAWLEWEAEFAKRAPRALEAAAATLADRIETEKFCQWLFFRQWRALKLRANQRGIKIIGDLPIFVALDSADVWTNPKLFKLGQDRRPTVVAGVPPDYFSATGQLWGNPIYDWEQMRRTGFKWWIDRLRGTFEMVDIVRVDHFRGFAACWEIPAGDTTAERGQWVAAPGRELLTRLKQEFPDLPIIAEDLGLITPDVELLRDEFGLPGMRVLQFAFDGGSRNQHLPHNYVRNCVAYTGTHDNDTAVGWFRSHAGRGSTRNSYEINRERKFCLKYLKSSGREIHWDFIRAVVASVADTAIVPVQDVLGLDSSGRMNLPASDRGNWRWRAANEALTDKLAERLRDLADLFGRLHSSEASI